MPSPCRDARPQIWFKLRSAVISAIDLKMSGKRNLHRAVSGYKNNCCNNTRWIECTQEWTRNLINFRRSNNSPAIPFQKFDSLIFTNTYIYICIGKVFALYSYSIVNSGCRQRQYVHTSWVDILETVAELLASLWFALLRTIHHFFFCLCPKKDDSSSCVNLQLISVFFHNTI